TAAALVLEDLAAAARARAGRGRCHLTFPARLPLRWMRLRAPTANPLEALRVEERPLFLDQLGYATEGVDRLEFSRVLQRRVCWIDDFSTHRADFERLAHGSSVKGRVRTGTTGFRTGAPIGSRVQDGYIADPLRPH